MRVQKQKYIFRSISSVGSEHPDCIGRNGRFEKIKRLGRLAQLVQSIPISSGESDGLK